MTAEIDWTKIKMTRKSTIPTETCRKSSGKNWPSRVFVKESALEILQKMIENPPLSRDNKLQNKITHQPHSHREETAALTRASPSRISSNSPKNHKKRDAHPHPKATGVGASTRKDENRVSST